MANAGINETGSFFKPIVVDGKPKKPTTATLDVNINGVVYCACDPGFLQFAEYPDEGSATSLALHYFELNRASLSDLKAIVVMGSMGEMDHDRLWLASHAPILKRLGVLFPVHRHTPPANTLYSVSLVVWQPRLRVGAFV